MAELPIPVHYDLFANLSAGAKKRGPDFARGLFPSNNDSRAFVGRLACLETGLPVCLQIRKSLP
jgi:hypothetical protein